MFEIVLPCVSLFGASLLVFVNNVRIIVSIALNFSLLTLIVTFLQCIIIQPIGNSFSIVFIILTVVLVPISIISTLSSITKDIKTYYVSILILQSILIIVFISKTLIQFYCSFELSLVPLFILIVIFGGINRYRAAFILFIYTLAGSLFILIAFIYIIIYSCGLSDIFALTNYSLSSIFTNISTYNNNIYDNNINILVFFALFFSLAVKTPLVPIHVWLPRAHAEANLAGSILLAGIVLKLATYGYIRLLLPFMSYQVIYFSNIVLIICLFGIIFSSLSAIRITDLKGLVAVSSVAHISIVVIGLFSNSFEGIIGAIILSIAHGFISPAAFYCVGGILYNRFHTRQIFYYSGLFITMPLFTTLFFLTCCGNIAVPFSINFIGELITLIGLYDAYPFIASIAASSILLSACYTLFLYNRISYGSYSRYLGFCFDLNRIEFNILFLLLLLTLFFGIKPNSIINFISYDVTTLLF